MGPGLSPSLQSSMAVRRGHTLSLNATAKRKDEEQIGISRVRSPRWLSLVPH